MLHINKYIIRKHITYAHHQNPLLKKSQKWGNKYKSYNGARIVDRNKHMDKKLLTRLRDSSKELHSIYNTYRPITVYLWTILKALFVPTYLILNSGDIQLTVKFLCSFLTTLCNIN